jgi:DNA-directed RNA polymerase subunit RPC12/RpoP
MKKKCSVCGKRFSLAKEAVYQITDPISPLTALTKGNQAYDAIDCPRCGCQHKLAIRLPNFEERENEDENENQT